MKNIRQKDLQIGNIISRTINSKQVIEEKEIISICQSDLPMGFVYCTTKTTRNQEIHLENGKKLKIKKGKIETFILNRNSSFNISYDLHN